MKIVTIIFLRCIQITSILAGVAFLAMSLYQANNFEVLGFIVFLSLSFATFMGTISVNEKLKRIYLLEDQILKGGEINLYISPLLSWGMVFFSILAAMSAIVQVSNISEDNSSALGVFVSLLSFSLFFFIWKKNQKRKIAISDEGIFVPIYGFIPWKEVEKIDQRSITVFPFTVRRDLLLLVKDAKPYKMKLNKFIRSLNNVFPDGDENALFVPVSSYGINLDVIYKICKSYYNRT